ncbi:MAG: aminotransferase class V-fold PLP-dependent enzyme [Thermomicrobiales bacterium]
MTASPDFAAIRGLFSPEAGTVYLDAATYGLPPRQTVDAAERAIRRWQEGSADWIEEWDRIAERCRALFAELAGSTAEEVALIPTVSAGVGLVAASLPAGANVIVPEQEFTSIVFPLLAAGRGRGAVVREIPLAGVASAIGPETDLVAFSLVRAQSGEIAPLAEIIAAARRHGARVLVDATHALPFVGTEEQIGGIDYLICHGYKHLLLPRGAGFMHIVRERQDELIPYFSGWRSGQPFYGHSYGGPLTLPATAMRFDQSLAWHAWAGALPSLELLVSWKRMGVFPASITLATDLAGLLEHPATGSQIVSVPVEDAERTAAALAASGVRCAARGGRVRLSCHVWNTREDIERAAAALLGAS